eukprot:COSAG04_NODE_1647_length_6060_cov_2.227646_1_plen_280_part_10
MWQLAVQEYQERGILPTDEPQLYATAGAMNAAAMSKLQHFTKAQLDEICTKHSFDKEQRAKFVTAARNVRAAVNGTKDAGTTEKPTPAKAATATSAVLEAFEGGPLSGEELAQLHARARAVTATKKAVAVEDDADEEAEEEADDDADEEAEEAEEEQEQPEAEEEQPEAAAKLQMEAAEESVPAAELWEVPISELSLGNAFTRRLHELANIRIELKTLEQQYRQLPRPGFLAERMEIRKRNRDLCDAEDGLIAKDLALNDAKAALRKARDDYLADLRARG